MTTDRSIVAPAPRSRAWSALTDLREFSQWFNVECNSGSFSPGDRVDMVCTTPGYEGVKFYLVVEEMTAEQRFGWRWHPRVEKPGEDFSSDPLTHVVFELDEVDGGTLVRHLQ